MRDISRTMTGAENLLRESKRGKTSNPSNGWHWLISITEKKIGATAEQPEAPCAVQNLQIQQHHACVGEVKPMGSQTISTQPTNHCGQVGEAKGGNVEENGLGHSHMGHPEQGGHNEEHPGIGQ